MQGVSRHPTPCPNPSTHAAVSYRLASEYLMTTWDFRRARVEAQVHASLAPCGGLRHRIVHGGAWWGTKPVCGEPRPASKLHREQLIVAKRIGGTV